jgi:hypothetical protein
MVPVPWSVRRSWPGDRGVRPKLMLGFGRRGRSGLRRAGRWATPTRGDPRESATENRPPPEASADVGAVGGKGETVVQETTSDRGDPAGSANPARSKVKKPAAPAEDVRATGARTSEGGPPEYAGRPQEAAGNGGRRWMVAPRPAARPPGTEPGLQASSSAPLRLTWGNVISRGLLSAYCPQKLSCLPRLPGSPIANGRPHRPSGARRCPRSPWPTCARGAPAAS